MLIQMSTSRTQILHVFCLSLTPSAATDIQTVSPELVSRICCTSRTPGRRPNSYLQSPSFLYCCIDVGFSNTSCISGA